MDNLEVEKQIPSQGLLDKIIEMLIEEKIFNITLTDNDKYEERLISLSNDIRNKLGLEQNLFIEYEELSTFNENASLRDAYKQGFVDGVALFREMFLKV